MAVSRASKGRLYWREAASLIVVGRHNNVKSKDVSQDINVLFLKRNQKSSFMPNAYVFPGGVIEPSDFSDGWLDVFRKCGYNSSDLKEFRNNAPLPGIYTNKPYSILPEVAFRIGAIREAFEECGLLLAHNLPYKSLDQNEIKKWQGIVHQDSSKFIAMFEELGGCPAVWNLHEWITWLTPAHLGSHRFDTAFFITVMEKIPKIVADEKEVVDVKVESPSEMLKEHFKGNVSLPPPQVYEVNRLCGFKSHEDLETFARLRGKEGMDSYFPVRISVNDGILICLPGDDLYPEQPDYTGEKEPPLELDKSIEELRNSCRNLHRMEMKNMNIITLNMNITLKYGHRPVLNFNNNTLKNRL